VEAALQVQQLERQVEVAVPWKDEVRYSRRAFAEEMVLVPLVFDQRRFLV